MRIKKYVAESMRQALIQIKQELGEDAVILKTNKLPKKLFGLGQQDGIEVTAAIDDEARSAAPMSPLQVKPASGVYTRSTKPAPAFPEGQKIPKPFDKSAPSFARDRSLTPGDSVQILELKEDIREVKELVKSIVMNPKPMAAGEFKDGWADLYQRLIDAEVKQDIAVKLVSGLQEKNGSFDPANEKHLIDVLSLYFPVAGPIKLNPDRTIRIAFVGPTGSGKTTTLAKLAAYLTLNKKKQVSIITADTYRIAAIDQIRTFADIVNIGLQVVFSPEELPAALAGCENDDVVLIDTAGRSQKNTEHMLHLEQLLSAMQPDETHLVLSATTKDSDLMDSIDRYRSFGVNRLLFTKLDETGYLGNVLNAVSQSSIPVSYFTFGQSIPDDIELAQPGRFIQRLSEARKNPSEKKPTVAV